MNAPPGVAKQANQHSGCESEVKADGSTVMRCCAMYNSFGTTAEPR